MAFTPDHIRARFREAKAERDRRLADLQPTRDAYEALRAQQAALDAQIKPLRDTIQAANQAIGGLDCELALLAKAVGGQTGEA